MSYNVIAYQVDKIKIKEIWGSNNNEFSDYFLNKYKVDIEEQLSWFEIEEDIYKNCLNDLIKGKITQEPDLNYIFGYIYEMLCQEFGEMIKHADFLSILEGVTEDNYKAFIPIPKNEDWPEFYSVEFENIENSRKLFLDVNEEYAKKVDYINQVNLIFNTALKNKKDIVFFGY